MEEQKTVAELFAAALTKLEEAQADAENKREWPRDIELDGYKLVLTCPACPEQYDVLLPDGQKAGYLRLRHGSFRADAPVCGGDTVYRSNTKGDGMFDDDERLPQLKNAVAAIREWWVKRFSI